MKKHLIALALLSTVNFGFQQQSDATLAETTQWMSSKVVGYYSSYLNTWFNVSLTWNSEKKKMVYRWWQTKNLFEIPSTKAAIEFNPKDIDPKSIYSEDINPNTADYYVKIHFSCNAGSGCIKQFTEHYNAEGVLTSTEDLVNWKSFDITLYPDAIKNNENLPSRFITSFKHLIFLCGGKGEKF